MALRLKTLILWIISFLYNQDTELRFFLSEFVSNPIAKVNTEDGQAIDGKIFHFQPEGFHAHIQVLNLCRNW